MKSLQQHSNKAMNQWYQQIKNHKYNLRSQKQSSFQQNCTLLNNTGPNRFKQLTLQKLTAQQVFTLKSFHIFQSNGKKETIDTVLNGNDKEIWEEALSNEWGRLVRSNKYGVRSTDIIEFITKEQVPKGRDITYATFVLDYCPLKEESF